MALDTVNKLDNTVKEGLTSISARTGQWRYGDINQNEQWLQPVSTYKALEKIKRGQAVSVATPDEFDEYARAACTSSGATGWVAAETESGKTQVEIKTTLTDYTLPSKGDSVTFGEDTTEYTITAVTEDDYGKYITLSEELAIDVANATALTVTHFDTDAYNEMCKDPDSYIVLTNTTVHEKCIGLALQPASAGDLIHIQPFGKFTYDTAYEDNTNAVMVDHTDDEYNPGFTWADVGKKVYVMYPDADGNHGYLTVDEELVYKNYHNIICLGYLTDAPVYENNVAQSTTTVVEISISGDQRGVLDSTQFEAVLGEDVTIAKNDPIRVFCLGEEYDTKFKYRLRLTPQNTSFNKTDFIAIQKMDGKTAYIAFSEDFDTSNIDLSDDKAFIHMGSIYDEANGTSPKVIIADLKDAQTKTAIHNNISKIEAAFAEAFEYVSGFGITYSSYEPTGEYDFYAVVDFESDTAGGYFEVYQSSEVEDHFAESYTYCNGSTENHGTVVLADIRVPSRKNLLGIYYGAKYGTLKKGYRAVFMRMGEFTLPSNCVQEFPLGEPEWLGFNGRVTTKAYNQYDYVSRVCTCKETNKLVIDVSHPLAKYNGDFPVGYMKPALYDATSKAWHCDYGFALMDGTTDYSLDDAKYKILYERLEGWYDMSLYTDTNSNTFKIPKVVRMMPDETDISGQTEVYMAVKYLSEGIFEEIPRIPFIRNFGTFDAEAEGDTNEVLANIEPFEISAIIDTGINENGYEVPDMDALDCHLFVDTNDEYVAGEAHNWTEIHPGFFNYNNSTVYGYEWKLRRSDSADDYAPYGRYELYADIGEGRGIAYVTSKNQAPRKLTGCCYKVYVARREVYNKYFDINGTFLAYLTNNVYEDDTYTTEVTSKAVTGKAVLDAIANRYQVDKLISNEGAIIRFGSVDNTNGKKVNATADLQLVSDADELPIVNDRIILESSLDTNIEDSATKSQKVVVADGHITIENRTDDNIRSSTYEKTSDKFTYVVADNEIPTVGQLRNHSDLTIDGTNYLHEYSLNSDEHSTVTTQNGLIHGMKFGWGGNINATKVDGVGVRTLGASDLSANVTVPQSGKYPYISYNEYDSVNKSYVRRVEGFERVYDDYDSSTSTQDLIAVNRQKISTDDNSVDTLERTTYVATTTSHVIDYIKSIYAIDGSLTNATTNFSIDYDLDESTITFNAISDNNLALATIKAGTFDTGSLSKYKRIYGETYRDYYKTVDEEKVACNFTVLATGSQKYTSDADNLYKTTLGSALQAAYEMPLAYWQYNTDRDWYKKYLGVIVERVKDVEDFISSETSRDLFTTKELQDSSTDPLVDYENNEFTYAEDEATSIKEYLNSILDNSDTGQNITSTVGLLLKASQETQERLLKLEASTFGDDAETIPGHRTKRVFVGLPNVSPAPTNYGLNRLIRAICLEIYDKANPFDDDVAEGSSTTTSTLSRIDDIVWTLKGRKNNSDDTQTSASTNIVSDMDASTYPYSDVVDAAKAPRIAAYHNPENDALISTGVDVKTRVLATTIPADDDTSYSLTSDWLWTKNSDGTYTQSTTFNGVADAIKRITTKLNALTYSINNVDNINSEPTRLNTIRQNIEHIIREMNFDDKYVEVADENSDTGFSRQEAETYHDISGEDHGPYLKNVSRMDKLTNDLYNFTVTARSLEYELSSTKAFGDETSEFTKDGDSEQQVYITERTFNGKPLLIDYTTDTSAQSKGENETIAEETAQVHIPQNLNDYEYASLLDIIKDAIGDQYFRKIHNEYSNGHAVIDWDTTSTKESDDENKLSTFKEARLNETITERLDLIENALDNVVRKLSRKSVFEKDTDADEWLKHNNETEYDTHTDNDSFSETGKIYSIEDFVSELSAWLGYSQDAGGKYSLEETSLTHSFKNVWDEGLQGNTTGTSAEWAIHNKKRMQAGLEDILYRLQQEENKTARLNTLLGDEFNTDTEISLTYASNSWDASSETNSLETNKVVPVATSTYDLTDDIKDLLLTIYGTDTEEGRTMPTDYVHRSWIDTSSDSETSSDTTRFSHAGSSTKDTHNYIYRNIIEDFLHEMYFTPQSYILNDRTYVAATATESADSRRAEVYDFDCGTNLYDIPSGEAGLSFRNRKEFFNDIQSTNTDAVYLEELKETYGASHYRKSRFEVLEDEIRHLRTLLGVDIDTADSDKLGFEYTMSEDDTASEAVRNLKYRGQLEFQVEEDDTGDSVAKFNGLSYYGSTFYDSSKEYDDVSAVDQYNVTGATNILSFLLNNDQSNRLIRQELGYHKSEGYSQWYDPTTATINAQSSEYLNRHTVYDRLKVIEDEMVSDDLWENAVKNISDKKGNIFDITNYLGNYTWSDDNYTGYFGSLNGNNLTVARRTSTDLFGTVTAELSGHNDAIKEIYSYIGVDGNADDIDSYMVSKAMNVDGTQVRNTLWGRLNNLEKLNLHDLDITNVIVATYQDDILITRFLTADDEMTDAGSAYSTLLVYVDDNVIYKNVIQKDSTLVFTYDDTSYTAVYDGDKVTMSPELDGMTYTIRTNSGNVIASTYYVDAVIEKSEHDIKEFTGTKFTHKTSAKADLEPTDVYGETPPVSVARYASGTTVASDDIYPSETSYASLVKSLNLVIKNQQVEINTLQTKLSSLAGVVNTTYDKIDTFTEDTDLESLLDF